MKAVVFDGKGHAITIEKPVPEIPQGYALVKVMAAGICGTDIETLYHNPNQPPDAVPGHEISGVIESTNGCKTFAAGDRVVVNIHVTCLKCDHCKEGNLIFCKELTCIGFELDGGDAEYVLVPEVNLRAIPADITYEQGVLLTDALGTPFHAVKKADIKKGELVGVSGAGPLGIMCILSVLHFGGIVVAIDVVGKRLEAARKFGAAYTVNALNDVKKEVDIITGGKGLDKVIECSGSEIAIKTDLEIIKCRGIMVQVGVCTKLTLNLYDLIVAREIIFKGSRNFHDSEIPEMIELIRNCPNINDVFTHRFTLDEAQQAFDIAERREGLKILLMPDGL